MIPNDDDDKRAKARLSSSGSGIDMTEKEFAEYNVILSDQIAKGGIGLLGLQARRGSVEDDGLPARQRRIRRGQAEGSPETGHAQEEEAQGKADEPR